MRSAREKLMPPDSLSHGIILKRNRYPVHRNVFENDDIKQRKQQKHVKPPSTLHNIPNALPANRNLIFHQPLIPFAAIDLNVIV